MIVHASPGKKKSASKTGKGRSVEFRAKQTLKLAIANGTIRDLLWNDVTPSASESSDEEGTSTSEAPEVDGSLDWKDMLQRKPLTGALPALRATSVSESVPYKPLSPAPSNRNSISRGTSGGALSENIKDKKKLALQKKQKADSGSDPEKDSSDVRVIQRAYVRPKTFVDIMRKLKEGVQEAKTAMLDEVEEDPQSIDDGGGGDEGRDDGTAGASDDDDGPATTAAEPANAWKEGDISTVHIELDIKNDNDVLWGGVMGKVHQAQEAAPKDVLADLFLVSNQLRNEREALLLQNFRNEGSTDKTTGSPKYHDAAEEARQRKQGDLYKVKQIAMVKMRSHAEHHRTHHQSNVVDFATFWVKLLEENEKFNSASLYDTFTAPLVVEGVLEEDEEVQRSGSASPVPATTQEAEPSAFHLAGYEDSHGLESALQDELSMLYITKTKLANAFAASADGHHHAGDEPGAPRNLAQTVSRLQALFSDGTYRQPHGLEHDSPTAANRRPDSRSPTVGLDEGVEAGPVDTKGAEGAPNEVDDLKDKKHNHEHGKHAHRHHHNIEEDPAGDDHEGQNLQESHHRRHRHHRHHHHHHHRTNPQESDDAGAVKPRHRHHHRRHRIASPSSGDEGHSGNHRRHRKRRHHTQMHVPVVDIHCESEQPASAKHIRAPGTGMLHKTLKMTSAAEAPDRVLDDSSSDSGSYSDSGSSYSSNFLGSRSSYSSFSSYGESESTDNRSSYAHRPVAGQMVKNVAVQGARGARYRTTRELNSVVGHALGQKHALGRPLISELQHLRGIWPYDTSLGAFNAALKYIKAEQAQIIKLREARDRVLTERLQEERNKMLQERLPYPVHTNTSQEQKMLTFDTPKLCLVLSTSRGGIIQSVVEVKIDTVFITQSVVPDMITLRTHDTKAVPHGYLATYSTSQWNKMEQDINSALAEDALALRPPVDLTSSLLSTVVSTLESPSQYTIDSASYALPSSGQAPPAPSHYYSTEDQHFPNTLPAFLTELGLDGPPQDPSDLMIGSDIELDHDDTEQQARLFKIHFAKLGYAAFQQLVDLKQESTISHSEVLANPNPPRCLQIPRVFAATGAPRPLIVRAPPHTFRCKKRKHHQGLHEHSQFSIHADAPTVEHPASRYMDLIGDVVARIKAEQAKLRQKATELAALLTRSESLSPTPTAPATLDRPNLAKDEWEKMRFYDPYYRYSSVQDLGYQADGYVARGDEVKIAITGVAPYAAGEAAFASPTIPRQPRQFKARARSFAATTPVSPAKGRFLRRGSPFTGSSPKHGHSVADPGSPAKSTATETADAQAADEDPGDLVVTPPAVSSLSAKSPSLKVSTSSRGTAPAPQTTVALAAATPAPTKQLVQMQHYDAAAMEAEMNNELQIVMLIESRRIMQLYFAKKFLQLDMVVDVLPTPMDAATAFQENFAVYGLVLINYADLLPSGLERSLRELIPGTVERGRYSLVVFNTGTATDAELEAMERAGVADVMEEPYSLDVLKEVVQSHRRRRAMFSRYGHQTGWQA